MRTHRVEQERIIAAWQESGLSLAAFARREHIVYHRIVYWVKEWRRRQHDEFPSTEHFLEVPYRNDYSRACSPSPSVVRLRIEGRNELTVSVEHLENLSSLAYLIREVLH